MIGPYKVVDTLDARHANRQVLQVLDPKTGEHYAMKVSAATGNDYESHMKFLLNEEKALQEIGHHEHIIRFMDGGVANVHIKNKNFESLESVETYFNVYELIDQRDDSKGMEYHQIALVGAAVASACTQVHENEWVHRDIKPDNILVDNKFHAKLNDFGIAYKLGTRPVESRHQEQPTDIEEGTRILSKAEMQAFRAMLESEPPRVPATVYIEDDNFIMGTPQFMSPEQAQALQATPQSDVYSLGASLYEMITGSFTHSGSEPMDFVVSKQYPIPIPRISLIRPSVPEELGKLVMQMLSYKPKERGEIGEIEENLRFIANRG